MREQTCCFTGHRIIPDSEREAITARLEETILGLYQQGVRFYGAGGALGFDTLAADTVLRLKAKCPGLRLILVLPCLTQTRGWKPGDIVHYDEIKARADKVVYTSQEYTRGCMHKRNRHLVDYSGVCICYQTSPHGGTVYTVDYANRQGLKVINIAATTC